MLCVIVYDICLFFNEVQCEKTTLDWEVKGDCGKNIREKQNELL